VQHGSGAEVVSVVGSGGLVAGSENTTVSSTERGNGLRGTNKGFHAISFFFFFPSFLFLVIKTCGKEKKPKKKDETSVLQVGGEGMSLLADVDPTGTR
jgi:hypothetical protein